MKNVKNIVIGIVFLVLCVGIYFYLSKPSDNNNNSTGSSNLNLDIPDPSTDKIEQNRLKMYNKSSFNDPLKYQNNGKKNRISPNNNYLDDSTLDNKNDYNSTTLYINNNESKSYNNSDNYENNDLQQRHNLNNSIYNGSNAQYNKGLTYSGNGHNNRDLTNGNKGQNNNGLSYSDKNNSKNYIDTDLAYININGIKNDRKKIVTTGNKISYIESNSINADDPPSKNHNKEGKSTDKYKKGISQNSNRKSTFTTSVKKGFMDNSSNNSSNSKSVHQRNYLSKNSFNTVKTTSKKGEIKGKAEPVIEENVCYAAVYNTQLINRIGKSIKVILRKDALIYGNRWKKGKVIYAYTESKDDGIAFYITTRASINGKSTVLKFYGYDENDRSVFFVPEEQEKSSFNKELGDDMKDYMLDNVVPIPDGMPIISKTIKGGFKSNSSKGIEIPEGLNLKFM